MDLQEIARSLALHKVCARNSREHGIALEMTRRLGRNARARYAL
ncbi:MAG: hypothetical protein JWM99_2971 [Verrucomicrobiales bacterium]|nr:hypothetical protein [Verrucomicrobiales bacterium]